MRPSSLYQSYLEAVIFPKLTVFFSLFALTKLKQWSGLHNTASFHGNYYAALESKNMIWLRGKSPATCLPQSISVTVTLGISINKITITLLRSEHVLPFFKQWKKYRSVFHLNSLYIWIHSEKKVQRNVVRFDEKKTPSGIFNRIPRKQCWKTYNIWNPFFLTLVPWPLSSRGPYLPLSSVVITLWIQGKKEGLIDLQFEQGFCLTLYILMMDVWLSDVFGTQTLHKIWLS